MDRVELTETEALASIDEVIRRVSKPKPPEGSFNTEDFRYRYKELEGKLISPTAARRLLIQLEEEGFLKSKLFQEGAKRRRYWWKRNGTEA